MRPEPTAQTSSAPSVDLEPGFVGRGSILERLEGHFSEQDRMVTLSGPPGIGKTRLAREFIHRSADRFEGGVWFLDLAEFEAPSQLVAAMAEQLGIPLENGNGLERTTHALAGRADTLVVLDNLDPLISPKLREILRTWLARAPGLHLLVTSRSRIGLPFERCLTLEPLAVDEAVELFEAQARRLVPGFSIDAGSRQTVEELVDRLDRLPLAIKLAAGRTRVLSPEQMLDRLNQRFDLLDATGPQRLRSLRGAIATSWESLSAAERRTLAQCSVFRGPFSMEAAEAVVELPSEQAPPVLEVVSTLVDNSLLQSSRFQSNVGDAARGPVVLQMLESIRNFVAERLDDHADPAEVRRRHADYFRRRIDVWEVRYVHPDFLETIPRLEPHLDNLHRAYRWCLDERPTDAAALCSALADFYNYRRNARKASELVDTTLDRCDLGDASRLHAKLRYLRGTGLDARGVSEEAAQQLRVALELTDRTEASRLRASILINLGMNRFTVGHYDEAARNLDRAMAIAEREEFALEQTVILSIRGRMECEAGELDTAQRSLERALGIFDDYEAAYQESRVRINYGVLLKRRGRLDEALRQVERAVELADAAGHPFRASTERANLACTLSVVGEEERAAETFETAVELLRRRGLKRAEANTLLDWGLLRIDRGRCEQARPLLERARKLSSPSNRIGGFSNLGGVHAALSVVEARAGNLKAADHHLERAEAILEDAPSEQTAGKLARLLYLQQRHVDLLRLASRDAADPDRQASLEEVASVLPDRTAKSFEERMAARALESALDDSELVLGAEGTDAAQGRAVQTRQHGEDNRDAPRLRLGPKARWLELEGPEAGDAPEDGKPDDPRLDFSRRGPLRRLVVALADAHRHDPGSALSTYDLLEAGWPDQQVDPDSGTNRVYTAISRLRSLGFDEVLLTADDGYFLDPELDVEWAHGAPRD